MTLLSVAAAALLSVVLMGSVWFAYFTGKSEPFTLPPPLPSGSAFGTSAPGPAVNGASYTPLIVDARNIQALLATIERPEAYRRTVECVSYWPGGEDSVTHDFARRGGLTRVETRRGEPLAQNRVYTPGLAYLWTGGAMPYHRVSHEDEAAEELSGIPTWETVAALPPESVLFAEYLSLPGERCLRVLTVEAVYFGEYIVSLETGLLVRAAFTGADGELAYECTALPPDLGDPGNERFTLPDGRLCEE